MTSTAVTRETPSNLEAEESLLGAMLLSRDAVAVAVQTCTADDFYSPNHGQVFGVMCTIHRRGEPLDPVTVADELRRAGLLDAIGGSTAELIRLQANTPLSTSAGRYAAIVVEHAQTRRMIAAALGAADAGYSGDRDRAAALLREGISVADRIGPATADGPQTEIEALIGLSSNRLATGAAILDAPAAPVSVWGDGHRCLWASGEPFILAGPDGVGKTTVAQQLTLSRIGLRTGTLLGMPVAPDDGRVLYIAADRPSQALRSFRRMVTDDDRQLLDERLVLWRGPLPFDIAKQPEALIVLAKQVGAATVVIDSLKDIAADLSKEEVGQRLNGAFQAAVAEGVEVCALHHQRKAQTGAGKPRHLADVYGSRWITAGAGSVLMLWGEPGDLVVEADHLKQPDEQIGPLKLLHDHAAGTTTVVDQVDAWDIVQRSRNGTTAFAVACALFATIGPDRNETEKARRQLERLAKEGKIHRKAGNKGGIDGGEATTYYPLTTIEQVS